MALDTRPYIATRSRDAALVDPGLRAFMLRVYSHMSLGVALTGLVAIGAFMLATTQTDGVLSLTPFGVAIYTTPLKWLVMLSPLAIVMAMSFGAERLSAGTARVLFYVYAALVGLSLSTVFVVFTGSSVARVFFVSSATFGALSLWGYTTKRDLSGFGTFLFMGLIGLLLATLVNVFLASSAMQFLISVAGVLIFAGLTAWDTQMLKSMYYDGQDGETHEKNAVFGALRLYLDFINLFMYLLQFLGDRR